MQEAQAAATQQVEAIALAVSMVMGNGDKTSSSESKPQTAQDLEMGLTAFMKQGG